MAMSTDRHSRAGVRRVEFRRNNECALRITGDIEIPSWLKLSGSTMAVKALVDRCERHHAKKLAGDCRHGERSSKHVGRWPNLVALHWLRQALQAFVYFDIEITATGASAGEHEPHTEFSATGTAPTSTYTLPIDAVKRARLILDRVKVCIRQEAERDLSYLAEQLEHAAGLLTADRRPSIEPAAEMAAETTNERNE